MAADTQGWESSLSEAVIGSAFEVANVLGAGFLERVYHRALARELSLRGIRTDSHARFPVYYKGQHVGDYLPDLVADDRLIVEVTCVDRFAGEHAAQCINYLKASGLHLALLINFQRPHLEWKRIAREL